MNEELVFADDADDIGRRYPDLRPHIRTLTFIPAKLEDNPALMAKDPGYYGRLLSLTEVDRERLLRGNWKIRYASGTMFRRSWFPIQNVALPAHWPRVRFWDEASTEDGGDWTVGALLALDVRNDVVYIEDVIRGQWDVAARERAMFAAVRADESKYPHLHTVWEVEPGSSGKTAFTYRFQELRKITRRKQHPFGFYGWKPTGSKVERAKPVAIRAERGHHPDVPGTVGLVLLPGSWNEPYIAAHTAFPNPNVHDDDVDATSGAHIWLYLNHKRIAKGVL